jgi:hypothetical protein
MQSTMNKVFYTFEITVDENMLNDAAKELIPNLIREFAIHARVKMALVASTHAVQMECVRSGPPDYADKPFELLTDELQRDVNPER